MPHYAKNANHARPWPYGTAAALFGGGNFEMPGPPGATKRVQRGKSGEAAYAARTVGRWETGGKAPEAAGAAGPSVLNRLGRREDGAGVAVGWTLPKATATAAQEGKAVARERMSAVGVPKNGRARGGVNLHVTVA